MNIKLDYSRLDALLERATEENPFLEGELKALASRLLEIRDVYRRARAINTFIDLLIALSN